MEVVDAIVPDPVTPSDAPVPTNIAAVVFVPLVSVENATAAHEGTPLDVSCKKLVPDELPANAVHALPFQ